MSRKRLHKIRLLCGSIAVTIDTLKIGKSASIDDFIGCGLPMIRLISCFSFSKKYIDNYGFLIRFRCSPIPFIQWGKADVGSNEQTIKFNIAYTSFYEGVCTDNGNFKLGENAIWCFIKDTNSQFKTGGYWPKEKALSGGILHWIAIGK